MKKIASINDLSGIGRCSLTANIPIISSLKIQCCPFPTAVLSSQTQYDEFSFLDLTEEMIEYSKVWKNLNLEFDCIYSGFLGSKKQIDIVSKFIDDNKNSFIVIDPILGDNGILYPTFDYNMCTSIKKLVEKADLTTPNITEACFLIDKKYDIKNISKDEIIDIAKEISKLGPKKVVITGIINDNTISNLGYHSEKNEYFFIENKYNKKSFSGTGDIFTSIICSLLIRGFDFKFCVQTASDFIQKCVEYTSSFSTNTNDGVMFEYFLNELTSI